MPPTLETRYGRVRGTRGRPADGREDLCVFRGVPFAAPPVGALRLRPPEPPAPWPGERDATLFADAPPQNADPMIDLLGLLGDRTVGEDCLALNVWTPGLDAARRPVLVWIHGGAFITGTGGIPLYDGSRLAARGDAVVVTLNYRVGALGFLHREDEPDAANLGLQDQLAALAWVRDHADRLGGDPANVTVFGESAGAGSIAALLAMPAARGLFRRALVQSAAPDGMIDADRALERTARFLAELELVPGRTASARLRDMPLDLLLAAQRRFALAGPFEYDMPFLPVIDGKLLPRRPLAAVADGSGADVELVVGTTADEMRLFTLGAKPEDVDELEMADRLARELPGDCADGRPRAEAVAEAYRSARIRRGESVEPADLLYAIQSDLRLRVPSIQLAEAQARHQPRTWMYLFTPHSPLQGGDLRACHALDLPYTFGNFDAPGMADFAGRGPEVEAVSRRWMDAWLRFARDGEPGGGELGPWPCYDTGRRATLEIGESCRVVDAPRDAERAALLAALGQGAGE